MNRWCSAYSYGHNVLRLVRQEGPSADCSRFAHAYADITEDIADDELEFTLDVFALHWAAGEVEPDDNGTYHRRGPWIMVSR